MHKINEQEDSISTEGHTCIVLHVVWHGAGLRNEVVRGSRPLTSFVIVGNVPRVGGKCGIHVLWVEVLN